MAKEFKFHNMNLEDMKKMGIKELADHLPARQRRSLLRGFTEEQKKLIKKLEKKNTAKTHCREMIILPMMVGKTIKIHRGSEFVPIIIQEDMVGHRLGEFAMTRKRLAHSAPGVGATKSSSNVSVK